MTFTTWLQDIFRTVVNVSPTSENYIRVDPTVNDIVKYSVAQTGTLITDVAHASGGFSDSVLCTSDYMVVENISHRELRTSSIYFVEWTNSGKTTFGSRVLQATTTNPGFPMPTVLWEGQKVLRRGDSFRIGILNGDGAADYTYTINYRIREVTT